MAIRKMTAIIRIRRGTYMQWHNANPVLQEGEISHITSGQDALKLKIGNGIAAWRDLPFVAARFPDDVIDNFNTAGAAVFAGLDTETGRHMFRRIVEGPGITVQQREQDIVISSHDSGDTGVTDGAYGTEVWRWITFNDFFRSAGQPFPRNNHGWHRIPEIGAFHGYEPGDIVISRNCPNPNNIPTNRRGRMFLCVERTRQPPVLLVSTNNSADPWDWEWSTNMGAFEEINVLSSPGGFTRTLISLVPRLRGIFGPNVMNVVYNMINFIHIRDSMSAGIGAPVLFPFSSHRDKTQATFTVQINHFDSFGILSLATNALTRKMRVTRALSGGVFNTTVPADNYRFFGERSIDSFGGTLPSLSPFIASFEMAVPIVTDDGHTPNVFHFPGVGRNIFRDFLHGIRDSNPGAPPDDLTVITFTDSEEREKKAPLTRQMKKAKAPFTNAGLRFQRDKDLYKEWKNFLKCKYLCEVLPTVTTRYVLILDADDVAVQTFDGILDNFRKYNLPVLFGATLARFPDEEIDTVENRDSLGPFNYLNAGTCIGETEKVLEFYLQCCKVEPEDVLLNRGEQHTVRQVFDKCQDWVGFDNSSRVFQLVGTRFEKWTNITREDNKFIVKAESSG